MRTLALFSIVRIAIPALAMLMLTGGCRQQESATEEAPAPAAPQTATSAPYAPIERLEPMQIPATNAMTPEKVALGHQLFFDQRLSGDGQFSCYSCHLNERGLTYGKPLGTGPFGKPLPRNSPTLWNIGYHTEWYWDGRATTLEGQALAAWKGVNMGADPAKVATMLNSIPAYRQQFQKVFQQDATPENVSSALATYMRTIISKDTPWDRSQKGEETAITEEAKRGYAVFQKAKCDNCHSGFLFTSLQYHNVGIGMDKPEPDVGRFKVTSNEKDRGAFKVPTLRDIGDSGPYFHDGSVATLEEAVRIMVDGGIENPQLDRVNLQKAELTQDEMKALLAFLRSLDEPATLTQPQLP